METYKFPDPLHFHGLYLAVRELLLFKSLDGPFLVFLITFIEKFLV